MVVHIAGLSVRAVPRILAMDGNDTAISVHSLQNEGRRDQTYITIDMCNYNRSAIIVLWYL